MKVVKIEFFVDNFKVVEFNIDGLLSDVEQKFRDTVFYNNIELDNDTQFSTEKNPLDAIVSALLTTFFDSLHTTGTTQVNVVEAMKEFFSALDLSDSELRCVVSLQEVVD